VLSDHLEADLQAIDRIDAIPSILDVVCRVTGVGFAAVARVTENRWVACCVRDDIQFGLKRGGELPVATTLCNEIRTCGEPIIIDDVPSDPHYSEHHTPKLYGFKSYISMPIRRRDGEFFGTLCAIDPRPLRLNSPETVAMFGLFAELIAFHLDAQRQVATLQADLSKEVSEAKLREHFIAVLGHDLRNPLASIHSGLRMLRSKSADTSKILSLLEASAGRMGELIEHVLDFARGRLGAGVPVKIVPEARILTAIELVIAELRSTHGERKIELRSTMNEPVACDAARIGQLLSNLVSNALEHGDLSSPVEVTASAQDGQFELTVTNHGLPIPREVRERLFEPFVRADVPFHQEGLGLGLYIAQEIARSHAGQLIAESSENRTQFIFRMASNANHSNTTTSHRPSASVQSSDNENA
jgi:signal transduction histidine kinase